MRTNFIINPRYKEIKSILKNIPEIFDNRGEIIHQNRRNTIKVIEYNGLKFNVKKFGKPFFRFTQSYGPFDNLFVRIIARYEFLQCGQTHLCST